jgi:hypothetical protein
MCPCPVPEEHRGTVAGSRRWAVAERRCASANARIAAVPVTAAATMKPSAARSCLCMSLRTNLQRGLFPTGRSPSKFLEKGTRVVSRNNTRRCLKNIASSPYETGKPERRISPKFSDSPPAKGHERRGRATSFLRSRWHCDGCVRRGSKTALHLPLLDPCAGPQ